MKGGIPAHFASTVALTVLYAPSQYVAQNLCLPAALIQLNLQWAPWNQSIFYQSEDYVLREKRRNNGDWADTDFAQADCMPGTNLAAIHSKNAERVVLFWQDREGWICYRFVT